MALTEEQASIVNAAGSARTLVTAGPGPGKTHVLIHRLSSLICERGMAPGELLVLSFSRSAVKEICDRLRGFPGNARYVRPLTFDSFATRILALADPGGTWQTENYEERIRHATLLIRNNPDARADAESYQHIVVDEIQDLVSDRAELVKELLCACSQGFSLFGDPAQGIYTYQLEGQARIVGSEALYRWVRARFGSQLSECTLSFNFRAASNKARIALWAGPELNSPSPDYSSIRYRLETDVLHLPWAGTLNVAMPQLRSVSMPTAILCRDNAQALVISGELHDSELPHILQRRATDRDVPPWVAIALRNLDGNLIGKRRFLEIMEGTSAPDLPIPVEIWQGLKRIERLRYPNELDLDIVNERLRAGDIPDDVTVTPHSTLVVSTIHRAKGLGFDRVFVMESRLGSDEPADIAEETRLLYVALTRARAENWHLEAPDTRFLWVREDLDRRWIRGGPKKWMRTGIEVRGEDIHKADPAGGFVIGESPLALQDYLRTQVRFGDPVVLRRREAFVEGESRVFYVVEHRGNPVGVTSLGFGGILFSALRQHSGWKVTWPILLNGLHVDGIDTVAGLPSISRQAGLGGCGTWLSIRVAGLGRFTYDTKET